MKQSLRILLTNHHLMSYHGSENFTFTIADFLRRKGHQVTVYSAYVGQLRRDFENIGVKVVTDLKLIKNECFDIAHVHHQINAYEIRFHFPHLPMVLLCQGVFFMENPPPLDLKISQYLATSERVKTCMENKGVKKETTLIFRNMVDSNKFYPLSSINSQPRKAIIVSNKLDARCENVIRQACKALNIKSIFIGERFRRVNYQKMPMLLNEADIVFSLGRGVIESMLCARIPVVFDYEGGDGMVTPSNITQSMTCNFSGNVFNAHYNTEELISILRQYRPEDGEQLKNISLEYFGAEKQVEKLIDIYYSTINKDVEALDPAHQKILASIVTSLAETRSYMTHTHLSSKWIYLLRNSTKDLFNRAKAIF